MSTGWQPIDSSPTTGRLLGCTAGDSRPYTIIFSHAEGKFIPSFRLDPVEPTHWMAFPESPTSWDNGQWLSKEQAPRTGYCLAIDPSLRWPVVVYWSKKRGAYVAPDGLGDETPLLFRSIPEVQSIRQI